MPKIKITLDYKQIENFYSIIKNLNIKDIFLISSKEYKYSVIKCMDFKNKIICIYKIENIYSNIKDDYFISNIPLCSDILLTKNNNGLIDFMFSEDNEENGLKVKTKYTNDFYQDNLKHEFTTINKSKYIFKDIKHINDIDEENFEEIGYFLIHNSEIKDLLKIFNDEISVKIDKKGIIILESVRNSKNPVNQSKTFILKNNIDENIIFKIDSSFLHLKSFNLNYNYNKIKVFENIKSTLYFDKNTNNYLFIFNSNKNDYIEIKELKIPMTDLIKIYSYEKIID